MIWKSCRAFGYGFLLYAGIPFVMDLPYFYNQSLDPIWGIPFIIQWGLIGGVVFVLAWFCLVLLQKIYNSLMRGEGGD